MGDTLYLNVFIDESGVLIKIEPTDDEFNLKRMDRMTIDETVYLVISCETQFEESYGLVISKIKVAPYEE